MSEFDLLAVAADGMRVERTQLDVAARNVAAAQASTPAHPYPRLVARFVQDAGGEDDEELGLAPAGRLRYAGTTPSGETADALTEMIAVLDAQRAYEADASVFDIGKRLAERTLQVGQSS